MIAPLPSDSHMQFGRWANILVLRGVSTETAETFALYESNLRSVLRLHPKGAGLLLLVMHDQPPPDGYAERVQDLLNRYREQVLAGCAVLTAQGFSAAVQRAVGTAILSVSRMHGKLAIHQSLEVAVPWLTARVLPALGRVERSRELRAALESVAFEGKG